MSSNGPPPPRIGATTTDVATQEKNRPWRHRRRVRVSEPGLRTRHKPRLLHFLFLLQRQRIAASQVPDNPATKPPGGVQARPVFGLPGAEPGACTPGSWQPPTDAPVQPHGRRFARMCPNRNRSGRDTAEKPSSGKQRKPDPPAQSQRSRHAAREKDEHGSFAPHPRRQVRRRSSARDGGANTTLCSEGTSTVCRRWLGRCGASCPAHVDT